MPDPADELPEVPESTYELGPEVARGGIGLIRRAVDRRMGRSVAIKELLPVHHDDPDTQARFVREALVTGRLEHPSIVPVYEAGRWPSGAPFYAMKLVSGRSLLELIRERPALDDRLALLPHVIAVAEAIAYAHAKRVIHRDIKPANVIVGTFGETVVIDWGLAKLLDDDVEPDKVMGTPAYMAPEQARGQPVDERTDVYALGALLYHVLAGCSPFAHDDGTVSMGETRTSNKAGGRDVVPLERRHPDIPTDLLTIVRKAMARDAGERYAGARRLADDLLRFQTGQLVSVHRYTAWALVRRWLRRHRALVSLAAAAVVAVGALGAVSVTRIVREREVADAQRREAQRRGAEAEARKNQLILLQAQAALDLDPTASLAWLKLYPAAAPGWDRARTIAIDAHSRGTARHVLRGHQCSIQAVAMSPDGAVVASGGTDQTIRVVALGGGAPVVLPVPGAVASLAYTRDGGQLLAAVDRTLYAWPLAGGLLLAAAPPRTIGAHDAAIANLALSPDGRTVATVSMDRTVRLWDLGGGAPRLWRGETYASWGVAFTPDRRTLLTGSEERNLRLWDVASGESRTVTNPEPFGPIAVSPDGALVALAGASGVHLWTIGGGAAPAYRALPRQSDYVIHLAFAPGGGQLATVNSGGSVRVWDLAAGKARALLGHQGHAVNVAYSGDGALLATSGDDATVRVWPIAELGDGGQTLHGLERATSHPRISPDGTTIAIGTNGGVAVWDVGGHGWRVLRGAVGAVGAVTFLDAATLLSLDEAGIRRWDVARGAAGPVVAAPASAPELLAVSPAGDLLVLGAGHDAAIVLTAAGAPRCRFTGDAMWSALFSPDGSAVAYVDGDRIMLGVLAGCTARELYRHAPGIISLAFAPDGRHLASAVDTRVALWNAATGAVTWLAGHTGIVSELAFSPDGKTLASGGVDHTIRLWDVATGTPRRVLTGHEQALRTLLFIDDDHLASGALDGTVRVWSLTGDDVRVFRSQEAAIAGLAAPRDGRYLVSTSRDVTRLWPLTGGGLPSSARGPAGLGAWLAAATTATIGPGDVLATP